MADVAVAAREQENPLVEGLERLPVPGTSLVIFGATGDLARRKLLPAIYNLAHEGALPERFNLIGVSRRDQSDEDFRQFARDSISEFSRRAPDDQVLDGLLERLTYIGFSFDDLEGYGRLSKALDEPLEHLLIRLAAGELVDRVARHVAVVLVRDVGTRDRDEVEALGQRPLVGEVVDRRQQLALREIAGAAEYHQGRGMNRKPLEALDERVLLLL